MKKVSRISIVCVLCVVVMGMSIQDVEAKWDIPGVDIIPRSDR